MHETRVFDSELQTYETQVQFLHQKWPLWVKIPRDLKDAKENPEISQDLILQNYMARILENI